MPQKQVQKTPVPTAPQRAQPIRPKSVPHQQAIEGMKWREVLGPPRAYMWRNAMIQRSRVNKRNDQL
ncbi:MAG: hypothetical protein KGO83_06925 [Paenibacillaceae bacterium]|nr:hypothetical protein [Paenibacillaceae bacterium]